MRSKSGPLTRPMYFSTCAGEHLQASQVALEGFGVMQVNVEADEIDVARSQELRGRIAGEGAQTFRVRCFGFFHQLVDKRFDFARAAPAHDIRRDFVGDAESEQGRMPPAGLDSRAHELTSLFLHGRPRLRRRALLPFSTLVE